MTTAINFDELGRLISLLQIVRSDITREHQACLWRRAPTCLGALLVRFRLSALGEQIVESIRRYFCDQDDRSASKPRDPRKSGSQAQASG